MPVYEVQLTQSRLSSKVARREAEGFLAAHHLEALGGDAALIVSELVTNAVLYGTPPLRLTLSATDVVRIAIFDSDPNVNKIGLAVRVPDPDAVTGRGLSIVDAVAYQWGVIAESAGKTVWATLERPPIVSQSADGP